MKKIILIIRNIFGIPTIFILMFGFLTPCTYFSSFLFKKKTHKKLLVAIFAIVRNISFKVLGVTIEFRGINNIPNEPCIIASNHQSAIETSLFFNQHIPSATYCLKKEITKVPMWARPIKKFGGIIVTRASGGATFHKLIKDIQTSLAEGNSVVIFPEGTRVPFQEIRKFKKGIIKIYKNTNVPVLPVALNTGKILPKKAKLIHSGHIIVEYLKPIPANLDENVFFEQLETAIQNKVKEISQID